jgi:hypothetical protein
VLATGVFTVTDVAFLDATDSIKLNAPVPVSIIYNLSPVLIDEVIVNVKFNVSDVVNVSITPIP